jgi:hypothetical protein
MFIFQDFFNNLLRKFNIHYNLTTITCTLHEADRYTDRYTLFITSRSIILKIRNVSDKSCRENQNTHFVFSKLFSKYRVVYEIMWENIVERGTTQMTIWRMRIECCISKAININPGYVTHCFSTAKTFAGTRLNVTLSVH